MIYAAEAELALIGAIIGGQQDRCEEATDRVKPEHFFDPVLARVWEAALRLARKGIVDPVSLNAAMDGDSGFQELGGLRFLADLDNNTWALSSHVELILDRAARRRISHLTDEISAKAYNTAEGSAEAVLMDLEKGAAEIAREGSTKEAWKPLAFLAAEAIQLARERKGMPGLGIGLTEVDRVTGGLRKGQLTLLAGRPGMGKSSAALSIAKGVAGQGRGVAFFSLEMTEPELGLRMACDVAYERFLPVHQGENPSYFKAEWGSLEQAQWGRLQEATKAMSSWPVMFDCRPSLTAAQIMAASRRIVRNWAKAGIEPGCIIVDHLGLIRPEQGRNGNKVAEIGDVSGALREMAKALEIPVIALCQLSRDVEKREGKDRRPNLSDLRWAGELEQDAHVVMFLYRPEYYVREPEPTGDDERDFEAKVKHTRTMDHVRNKLFWIIAKNRQGPTAEAETFCQIECSAIRDKAA